MTVSSSPLRARLVVLTDMTSVTAGELEPDDGQSLIRLLLYANQFEIEALVAGSNLEHGERCRPDIIHRIVEAYAAVQPNLARQDPAYPAADRLQAVVHAGYPLAGRQVPVEQSIGAGKETDASRALIRLIDRPDPRPVWVLVWGGTADLAQALWTVQRTRPPAAVAAFVAKIRVHAIGDQDTTGPWLKDTFPALFYITRRMAFRGMYRGGDTITCTSAWIQRHLRGQGALGDLYPDYNGGDIWSGRLGRVAGLKEGDTPSYLSLIPNGLNDAHEPAWGGWGGPLQPATAPVPGFTPHRWTDAVDPLPGHAADPDPHMAGVYRWRSAFQADFAARMACCVAAPGAVPPAPMAILDSDPQRVLTAGQTIHFDAGASRAPQNAALTFRWMFYPAPGAGILPPTLVGADRAQVTVTAPVVSELTSLHLVLAVAASGPFPRTAYRRVVLQIQP